MGIVIFSKVTLRLLAAIQMGRLLNHTIRKFDLYISPCRNVTQAGAPVFELFLDKAGIVFLQEMHATADIHHFEILDVLAATFDVVPANNSAGRSVSNVLKAHFVPRTAC
ncbi:hypothetical protein [Ruegeria atlantica]|uniref:Uncharacterized protein n=1 Tax=Ruegeria atlantica TaxID=81569 RepID=A0ABX1WD67_9RHOB|nr:hypothetical protein [Ruegeria atlantica]NOD31267.1 hypothetical protein [Ruegeria atlantica]